METVVLKYSEGKQHNIAWFFLLIATIGIAAAAQQWFYADPVFLSIIVGGIIMGILGIGLFLKLQMTPKRNDEIAIQLSSEGISASTTPVAKGAGLIAWQDIADVQIHRRELAILVDNPETYAQRMKSFFVRDTFKASKGLIRISFAEVDTNPQELTALINQFMNKK